MASIKVGPPVNETIRMNRRPRKDGAGGFTIRLPTTWEECHEVLCEIEGVKAGSKAFLAARAAGQTSAVQGAQVGHEDQYHQQGAFGDGKGRGKGKGKDGKGKGKGKGDGVKPPCWQPKEHGVCKYGEDCRFGHDAKDTGRTPTGALTKAAKPAAQAKA